MKSLVIFISIVLSLLLCFFGKSISGFMAIEYRKKLPHSVPSSCGSRRDKSLPIRLKWHHHLSQNNDDISDLKSLDLSSPSDEQNIEFWLDLRDTALFPNAAIDYLSENIEGNLQGMIERVLLSEEAMDQWIEKKKQQKQKSVLSNHTTTVSSLYVPSRSDDLVLSDETTQQSVPCGKVIKSELKTLQNPIVALDIVMGQGGWVLMEQNDEVDENAWIEEVSSLMTFLLSSTSKTSSINLQGLVLAANDNADTKSLSTQIGNGIAIVCSNRSQLMEVSKCILTLSGLPGDTSTSPGGILLPNSKPKNDESTVVNGDSLQSTKEKRIPVATVIPLDINLWQTAVYLMSDTQEENGSHEMDKT